MSLDFGLIRYKKFWFRFHLNYKRPKGSRPLVRVIAESDNSFYIYFFQIFMVVLYFRMLYVFVFFCPITQSTYEDHKRYNNACIVRLVIQH